MRQCIVCRERPGEISIRDGLVCRGCMPQELLSDAGSIDEYQLTAYRRMHRHSGWESCEQYDPKAGQSDMEDRSRVITTADDIVLADELNAQILKADGIDIVVSFILCSGLNLIIDALRSFTRHGRLRIITTTYMGATEWEAVDQLIRLPNTELKIEMGSGSGRLHAKCFLFKRNDGNSTVFIGSANISKSALTTGEEWEVKLCQNECPQPVEDVRRAFESLWNGPNFVTANETNRANILKAIEENRRGS